MTDLSEVVAKEKHRRQRLVRQQRPYRHWLEVGPLLAEQPPQEHWCDYCQGFYDVQHDMHANADGNYQPCPLTSRALQGDRQCDCLDCVCAERISGPDSLASRITQS